MLRIGLLLLSVLFAQSALADVAVKVRQAPGTYSGKFYGEVIVLHRSLAEVNRICHRIVTNSNPAKRYNGCGFRVPSRNVGYMVLPMVGPRGVTKASYTELHRHEMAHIMGWPAHHPR